MARNLYVDTTASDIGSPFIFSPTVRDPVAVGQVALGDSLTLALTFCDENGIASWSGATGYTIEAALGVPNSQPTEGTFNLVVGGVSSAALPYNATAAQIQSALEAFSGIGSGNVVVSGNPGGPFQIVGAGTLLSSELPAITSAASDLFPPSAVTVFESRAASTGIPQIQVMRIACVPAAYTNTFTASGSAWIGSLATNTAGIYELLGDNTSVQLILAIRVSGPAIGVRTFAQAVTVVTAALIDETALTTAPVGGTYVSMSEAVSLFMALTDPRLFPTESLVTVGTTTVVLTPTSFISSFVVSVSDIAGLGGSAPYSLANGTLDGQVAVVQMNNGTSSYYPGYNIPPGGWAVSYFTWQASSSSWVTVFTTGIVQSTEIVDTYYNGGTTTTTIDFTNFTWVSVLAATLGANVTIANVGEFSPNAWRTLVLTQDSTGGRTVTWPTGWVWPNGVPTLKTAPGATDIIRVYNTGSAIIAYAIPSSLSLAPATSTTLGGVIVPASGNLAVDGSGNLSVPVATSSVLGVVKPDGTTIVNTAGAISVPTATTSQLGLVKPDGSTIVDTAGVISVPAATTSALGLVKPDGVTIVDTAGAISVPTGSSTVAGVVKVDGTTITATGGVISSTGGYTLPAATSTTLGGVKPDGVTIQNTAGAISVPTATTSALGLVKPDGTTIVDTAGAISVPTATTSALGLVKPDGSTITIAGGVISSTGGYTLPTASTSVLGGVKVDGTTITISGGVISSSGGGGGTVANNVTIVDGINGNDSTGAVNNLSKPFATLHAAIAASSAGQMIELMPGSTYTETPASGVALFTVNNLHVVIRDGATLVIKATSGGIIAASSTNWSITGDGTLQLVAWTGSSGTANTNPLWAATFNGAVAKIDVALLQLVNDSTSANTSAWAFIKLVNTSDTAKSSLKIRAKDVTLQNLATTGTSNVILYGSLTSLTPTNGIDTIIEFGNVVYLSDSYTSGPCPMQLVSTSGEGSASSLAYRHREYYCAVTALPTSAIVAISSANHSRIDLDLGVNNLAYTWGSNGGNALLSFTTIASTDSVKIQKAVGGSVILGGQGSGPFNIDIGDVIAPTQVSGPLGNCVVIIPSSTSGAVMKVNFGTIRYGNQGYTTNTPVVISGSNAGSVMLCGDRIQNASTSSTPVCVSWTGVPGKTILKVAELVSGYPSAGEALYAPSTVTVYVSPGCETNCTTATSGVTSQGNTITVQSNLI